MGDPRAAAIGFLRLREHAIICAKTTARSRIKGWPAHGTISNPRGRRGVLRDVLRCSMATGVCLRSRVPDRHGQPQVLPPAERPADQRFRDHADASARHRLSPGFQSDGLASVLTDFRKFIGRQLCDHCAEHLPRVSTTCCASPRVTIASGDSGRRRDILKSCRPSVLAAETGLPAREPMPQGPRPPGRRLAIFLGRPLADRGPNAQRCDLDRDRLGIEDGGRLEVPTRGVADEQARSQGDLRSGVPARSGRLNTPAAGDIAGRLCPSRRVKSWHFRRAVIEQMPVSGRRPRTG